MGGHRDGDSFTHGLREAINRAAARRARRETTRHLRIAVAVSVTVVAADVGARTAVSSRLLPGEHRPFVPGVVLTRSGNDGIAFGLLGGSGRAAAVVGAIALASVLGAALTVQTRRRSGLLVIGMALLAAGGSSNLVERAGRGEVTDYLEALTVPPLNLADLAILIGVLLLSAAMVRAGARDPSPP